MLHYPEMSGWQTRDASETGYDQLAERLDKDFQRRVIGRPTNPTRLRTDMGSSTNWARIGAPSIRKVGGGLD